MKQKIVLLISMILLITSMFSSLCVHSLDVSAEVYYLNYTEYCELIESDIFPKDMLTFDKISFMGEFGYFEYFPSLVQDGAHTYKIKTSENSSLRVSIERIDENIKDVCEYYSPDYPEWTNNIKLTPWQLNSENAPYFAYHTRYDEDVAINEEGIYYIFQDNDDGNLSYIATVIPGYIIRFRIEHNKKYDLEENSFISELFNRNMTSERLAKLVSGEESLITTPSETTPEATPEATTPEEQPKTGCAAFSFALPAFSAVLLAPIMIFIRKRII